MKIQLVKAPCNNPSLREERWFTPLGLISIGTYLETNGFEVEILNGQHLSLKQIKRQLNAEIVGIEFNVFSTDALDEIAFHAKQLGSLVVVGGQAATPLARQLLQKNKDIDLVVRFDGEKAMKQIAERIQKGNHSFEGIPNIVFRANKGIVENPVEFVDLKTLPMPNRKIKGVELEKCIQSYGDKTFRPTSTATKRGCPRRCSFCARMDRVVRERTPQQAFDEFRYLVEEFNVNYIWDCCDTWFTSMEWLKEFRKIYEKNNGLNARFWAFCDARDLTEEKVKLMKAINVHRVLIGIESGNEKIRRMNGKPVSNKQILEACALLGKHGIKLEDSYVLGLLGETSKSVKETFELGKQLDKVCEREETAYSIIVPLPGSIIWQKMMQVPELNKKYANEYKFDIEEVRKDYFERFCEFKL